MSYQDRDYMRAGPPPFREWLGRWTAFRAVLVLNVAVFVLQWVFKEGWVRDVLTGAALRPQGGISVDELAAGHFWTPFTFMFVHQGWGSFLGNMLILAIAGRQVQDLLGGRCFLWIYFVAGLVGAALEMALSAYWFDNTSVLLMGASAPVLGLLLAYSVAMPEENLPLLPLSLPVFVRLLVGVNVLLAAVAVWSGRQHPLSSGEVTYFANLGGCLAGWYFARSLGYGGVPAHLLRTPLVNRGSSLRRRPELVRARSRRPEVDVDMEAVRRENPRCDPLVDLMRDEVDPILDKINDFGMASLTEDERRTLERASRRFSR